MCAARTENQGFSSTFCPTALRQPLTEQEHLQFGPVDLASELSESAHRPMLLGLQVHGAMLGLCGYWESSRVLRLEKQVLAH